MIKDFTEDDSNPISAQKHSLQDKFLKYGIGAFGEIEILELLLNYTMPQIDTKPIAIRLINKFGNLKGVFDASPNDLTSIDGVGEHSAVLIKTIPTLMQLYSKQKSSIPTKLSNQTIAKQYVTHILEGVSNEEFHIICLNADHTLINSSKISSGDFSRVQVEFRKITNYILNNNCDKVILVHNHPVSAPDPSDEDIITTHKFCISCILNEIEVVDHIIYSPRGCYSFAEHGTMTQINSDIMHLLKIAYDHPILQRFRASMETYVIK